MVAGYPDLRGPLALTLSYLRAPLHWVDNRSL